VLAGIAGGVGCAAGTTALNCENSGSAVKNSVAIRARIAGSGTPAGNSLPVTQTSCHGLLFPSAGGPGFGSLGLMVISDLDILQNSDSVFG